jgi:hypothetical protein
MTDAKDITYRLVKEGSGRDEFLGLGRKRAEDPRDREHHLAKLVKPPVGPVRSKYWPMFYVLDQGPTPQCVAFAWTGFLLCYPTRTTPQQLGATYTPDVYHAAQKIDEWDGEDYDGTSVRAGAKVLASQKRFKEYLWAWDATTVRDYVLQRGPVVLGTDWMLDMFYPEQHNGFIVPTGPVAGGHAYLVVGYSASRAAFRIVNSWGPLWGVRGRAWLALSDLQTLIDRGAEACSAVEVHPG